MQQYSPSADGNGQRAHADPSQSARAREVRRIMETLAALPGGTLIRLVTKNYPHVGPWSGEEHTHYREHERWFSADQLPPGIEPPEDPAEEVFITLEGKSPDPVDRAELLRSVWDLLDKTALGATWDVRAQFTEGADARRYELTVFTHPVPGLEESWQ